MKTTMMVRATSSSSSSTLVRPGDDRGRHRRHSPTTRVRALVDSEQEASPSSTTAADNLPQADDIVPAAVEAFLQRKGRHAIFKAAKGGDDAPRTYNTHITRRRSCMLMFHHAPLSLIRFFFIFFFHEPYRTEQQRVSMNLWCV